MSEKFTVIYADPPWRYDDSTPSRAVENHYPTMDNAAICALSVPSADDCVLYLWATAPKLREALDVIEAWGFLYRSQAVWDKVKLGMGYWFRGQHEILMVATKGKVSPPPPALRISSVIRCPRGAHSSKPDMVRELIAKWYPGPRLEMFSRLKRPGWEAMGNQIEHDLFSNEPTITLPEPLLPFA